MLRHRTVALAAAMLVVGLATAGEAAVPRAAGDYLVNGSCAKVVKPYAGSVRITPPGPGGQFSTLTWTVDGGTVTGRALDQDGALSVRFGTGDGDGGLLLMRRTPTGGYTGIWSYFSPADQCTETWTPQAGH